MADAKPAPEINKPVTVVLDPDLIALFAHEIIGHPSELDRALKWKPATPAGLGCSGICKIIWSANRLGRQF